MRIGIKFDSCETPELRALLALVSCVRGVYGLSKDHEATVRCCGPEMWSAETEMISLTAAEVADLLRNLAARLERSSEEMPPEQVLIKDADPELDALLDEDPPAQPRVHWGSEGNPFVKEYKRRAAP